MFRRQFSDSPNDLLNLYELVGDKEAAAAVTREIMGQTRQVEVQDVGRRTNG